MPNETLVLDKYFSDLLEETGYQSIRYCFNDNLFVLLSRNKNDELVAVMTSRRIKTIIDGVLPTVH